MARLSLLSLALFSLFVATSASSSQHPLANQDSPVHTTEGWSWADCGSPTDVIQIKSITVFPDPPKPGQNLTVTVTASAEARVEEGAYADVTVKLGLIKLLHKQFDLCEEARNAQTDVQCPVNKGQYVVKQTVALPKEIPQAKFTINARGYTVEDVDLFCVDLKVDFMKRPFPKLSLGW
ncbi:ML domain-containing protein [Russula brevipes]|nr:ML domain-containing protein [Russula brevipes]